MKSKTLVIIAVAALMLGGCGWFGRVSASVTGYSIACVKETGVQYVQFPSGAAPLYDKDNKIVPCE